VSPFRHYENKLLLFQCIKKGNSAIVSNYRPIYILNNFSKIFEFIIYDHLHNFFKCRLYPSQHGFRKFNSTATNLVTYLNSIIPSVSSQGQTNSVYFELTKAFDVAPHNIILRKHSNFGLPLVMLTGSIVIYLTDNRLFVFLELFRFLIL
jgi:hypothetical protein